MSIDRALVKGDRVRVVLEGEVTDRAGDYLEIEREFGLLSGSNLIKSVELLERPLVVGGKLEGSAAYDAAPVGTVVRDVRLSGGTYLRVPSGWRSARYDDLYGAGQLSDQREIVYLP